MLGLIWGALQHIILDNVLLYGGIAAGLLVALFGPQKLKDYGIGAAAVLLICFLVFNDGVTKGKADVQRQWDAAVQVSIDLGEAAHSAAEREVPPLPPPAPVANVPAPAAAVPARSKSGGLPAPCKPTSRYDRCK